MQFSSAPTSTSSTVRSPGFAAYFLQLLFSTGVVLALLLSMLSFSAAPADAQSGPIRINSGGPAYTDSLARSWSADTFFSGGNSYTTGSSVSGTSDPTLYQSERWGNFAYDIPVSNGSYTVTLHFAEIYFNSPGLRVFDILAEGSVVVDDLDPTAEVGSFAAYSRSFQVSVADGSLTLQSAAVVQNPKISAVEVLSAGGGSDPIVSLSAASIGFGGVTVGTSSSPSTLTISNTGGSSLEISSLAIGGAHGSDFSLDTIAPLSIAPLGSEQIGITFAPGAEGARQGTLSIGSNAPSSPDTVSLSGSGLAPSTGGFELRINSGGGSYTDSLGHAWDADTNFSGGSAYTTGGSIANTVDDDIYKSERWGGFNYSVPVPNGTYVLRLHFAEIFFSSIGQRVFDITAEGAVVVNDMDIVAEAGARTATIRSIDVNVSDGVLNISAVPVVQNPKISGIEIVEKPGVALTPSSTAFGTVETGTTSSPAQFTIQNNTLDPVTITAIGLSGADAGAFAVSASSTPFDIPASGQSTLDVAFTPTDARLYQASLVVTPSGLSDLQASLTGTGQTPGVGPVLSVSPGSLAFGTQTVGTTSSPLTYEVSNTGDDVLQVTSVALSGSDASEFTLGGQGSFSVPVGGSQTLSVQFSPTSAGAKQASIAITSNGGSAAVSLSGQAQDPGGSPGTIRINAGGSSYTDGLGNTWDADRDFYFGGTYTNAVPIAGTEDDVLYQSERFGDFDYFIPIANGSYRVTLHFAEIYFASPGQRTMRILAEDVEVISDYDITAAAGARTATTRVLDVTVNDGELSLMFFGVIQNAKISALEVTPSEGVSVDTTSLDFGQHQVGSVSPIASVQISNTSTADVSIDSLVLSGADASDFSVLTTTPLIVPASGSANVQLQFAPSREGSHSASLGIVPEAPYGAMTVSLSGSGQSAVSVMAVRINSGGPEYTDSFGSVWSADTNFSGGQAYVGSVQVTGTPDPALYQSERWGTFEYAIPVINGLHQVNFHFAEIYFSGAGFREFDVSAEGTLILDDFDIAQQAGGAQAAMVQSVDVLVSDGVLNINFSPVFQQPKVSALEILLVQETVDLQVAPNPIDTGTVVVGGSSSSTAVQIDNTGGTAVTVTDLGFSGLHAGDFSTSKTVPFTIPAGGSTGLAVVFQPSTAGAKSASLSITSNDPKDLDGVQSIDIVGRTILNAPVLAPQPASVDFGAELIGNSAAASVVLRSQGAQALVISDIRIEGSDAADFSFTPISLPQTLLLDEAVTVSLSFNPTAAQASSASLVIDSNSVGGAQSIPLAGLGIDSVPIGFTSRAVATSATPGLGSLFSPTSLTFGPDGRLYVGQLNGLIHAITFDSDHDVVSTEVFSTIHDTPTFNDDGSPATGVSGRLVTGIWADPASSPTAPVLYVTHSDIRIGTETNGLMDLIDTDGGAISKLVGPDFDNPANRTDLVVGLPRSRENHAPNGIQIGPDGWLYVSVGGHTNYGAPSTFFGNLPEVNLSAVVVRLNKDAATGTLDVSAGSAVGSVTGDGEVPGMFEVYADGYRNGYDLLWHSNGKLYLNMNEGNSGLGNTPGPADGCPSASAINPGTLLDKLFIVPAGAYGGHPLPARGHCVFQDGTAYNPDLPVDPDYVPHIHEYQGSVSTNGMAEYTSLAFNGQMFGDIITVSTFLGDEVRWLELSADGSQVLNENVLASGMGGPIDVLVHSDGTIFVAEFSANAVSVLEPQDSSGTPGDFDGDGILDINDPDDDNDGYTDDDEIANGTNPTNPAQFPSDFDGDFVSDLLDDDDDNDTILDVNDSFVFDPLNGSGTALPVKFEWDPGDTFLGKLRNTGFTGYILTSNGSGFLPSRLNVGAAGGFMAMQPTAGTLAGAANSQDNALQIGLDATPINGVGPFTVTTRIVEAFQSPPAVPQGGEGGGVFAAIDEDNYVRLALVGNGGSGSSAIQFSLELGGVLIANVVPAAPVAVPGPEGIELFLGIDPENQRITALYRVDSSAAVDLVTLGTIDTTSHPGIGTFFSSGLGVGLLTTLAGESSSFVAVFDYFRAVAGIVGSGGAPDAEALLAVDAGGTLIGSSTYNSHSFGVTNTSTGGQYITRLRIDIRTAALPDVIFDIDGIAGDTTGKPFTVDGEGGVGVVAHQMRSPLDGFGHQVLDVVFGDFEPGEYMSFSIDMDPSSVKGATPPGPSESGSVSGLEIMGASVTAFFDDSSVYTAQLQRTGTSEVASSAVIGLTTAAPPVLNITTAAAVPSEVYTIPQTVQLTGIPGADVVLYVFEGGLFTQGLLNGGFNIAPYEANSFIALSEYPATLNGSGVVDIPISLLRSQTEGGLNYIFAIQRVGGVSSAITEPSVLELLP